MLVESFRDNATDVFEEHQHQCLEPRYPPPATTQTRTSGYLVVQEEFDQCTTCVPGHGLTPVLYSR